jgi:hypothetical protein
MMTQIIDLDHFSQKARQIRAEVAMILTRWGLLPRFKRWRLTRDPGTGMIVLFGILNNRYIATHTSIPFSDYFDPRLLHDLENELQVQVVSCNSDGLRYAFILERGHLEILPTHIDFPFIENGRLLARAVYPDTPQSIAAPHTPAMVDDQTLVRQGVGAFLKVFDDIKLRDDAALQLAARALPDVVLIDEEEFKRRVAEQETSQKRSKRIRNLFNEANG